MRNPRPGRAMWSERQQRQVETTAEDLDSPFYDFKWHTLYGENAKPISEYTPDEVLDLLREGRRHNALAADDVKPDKLRFPSGTYVYYIRIGNRIKIGFSSSLDKRMSCLAPEEVLGLEPGGRDVELSRHVKFKPWRTHGEWFVDCRPIREHIAAVNVL